MSCIMNVRVCVSKVRVHLSVVPGTDFFQGALKGERVHYWKLSTNYWHTIVNGEVFSLKWGGGRLLLLLQLSTASPVTCVGVPNWFVFELLETDQTYSCVYVLLNFTRGDSTNRTSFDRECWRLHKCILCKCNVCGSVGVC